MSFERLKLAFCETLLLEQFQPQDPIYLETDASNFAISGILSQKDSIGHKHPIAFFSRKINSAERNYSTPDHELLAIVASFKAWRHYLEGAHHTVTILTDHHNLTHFLEKRPLSHQQAHWGEYLSGFDFKIEYQVRKRNPADAPSWHADYVPDGPDSYTLLPFFKLTELTLELTQEATVDILLNLKESEDPLPTEAERMMSHTLLDELRTALKHNELVNQKELLKMCS